MPLMPSSTATAPGTGSATENDPNTAGQGARGATLLGSWRAHHSAALAAHIAHHGPLPLPHPGDSAWPARLAGAVEASGLTGRGGAAFPSWAKLTLVRSVGGGAVVVVNAMEGEPASDKDKALLACVPHLVLDGAELAAVALAASRIVVCVADDRPDTARSVAQAVAERAGTPLSPVTIEVVQPPGRYVAGEESALVSWLAGARGAPTFRPHRGVPLSIGRRAALVHNAETLAHMALIARYGAGSFRSVGLEDAPGTSLVTVTGGVAHPGVYEIAMGAQLGEVIGRARPTGDVAAVLTGGFGGSWVPASALGTAYAPRPMREVGGVVGAGVLVVLPGTSCGIAETACIATYMAGESAGQCGPCVFGLPAIADDLAALAPGRADAATMQRLQTRLEVVSGRGACRHPDGVVRMVRSALAVFADDAAGHAAGRPCAHRTRPSVLPPMAAR